MSDHPPSLLLSQALLTAAPAAVKSILLPSAALEQTLADLLGRARQEHPELKLTDEAFLAHLAQRLPAREPMRALAAVDAGDLFLACACVLDLPGAIAEFEQAHARPIAQRLSRMASAEATTEDLAQLLRLKLFVRTADQPPRIAEYSGRGSLAGWLGAVATRLAIDAKRTERDEIPFDQELAAALPMKGDGTEVQLLKRQIRQEFEAAVRAALGELAPRDRAMLHMQHVEKLSFDQIGAFYRVNKSTISRWLATAREQVLMRCQALLRERLNLKPSELESVMRAAQSHLDVSVITCLGNGEREED